MLTAKSSPYFSLLLSLPLYHGSLDAYSEGNKEEREREREREREAAVLAMGALWTHERKASLSFSFLQYSPCLCERLFAGCLMQRERERGRLVRSHG